MPPEPATFAPSPVDRVKSTRVRVNEDKTVCVGTLEAAFEFIAERHYGEAEAPQAWLDVETAWWPEAVRHGIEGEPDFIDETGLAVFLEADLATIVAPCDFEVSGHRFLEIQPAKVAWRTKALHACALEETATDRGL